MKGSKQKHPEFAATARGLGPCVEDALEQYFNDLDGHEASDLYDLVISQVERPLLEIVLEKYRGNISRTARALGLNRGTLRSRLKKHGIGN